MSTNYNPNTEQEQYQRVRCRFCNKLNKTRTDVSSEIHPRCGRCHLPLSEVPHHKWKEINPDQYIHPLDRQALAALRKVPGIDSILKKILEFTHESASRVFFSANSIQVNEQQYPALDAQLNIVCQTLNVPKPDLYIALSGPQGGLGLNAFTGGVEHPFIVIYASLLERLEPVEVLSVLAHEVGHIHCRHLLYKVAADLLVMVAGAMLKKTPIGGLLEMVSWPVQLALLNWSQKAELSCDRAALLVTQEPRAVMSTLMKMAGGSLSGTPNLDAFIEQARAFDRRAAESYLDKFWTLYTAGFSSHPFPVWRVAEVLQWVEQEDGYAELLLHD